MPISDPGKRIDLGWYLCVGGKRDGYVWDGEPLPVIQLPVELSYRDVMRYDPRFDTSGRLETAIQDYERHNLTMDGEPYTLYAAPGMTNSDIFEHLLENYRPLAGHSRGRR